jgi:hypothetical protein
MILNHAPRFFQAINTRRAFLFRLACILIFTCSASLTSFGDIGDEVDELSVNVNVKGIGSAEIPALYFDDELYLSVVDVFKFLKIKNTFNESMDSISGYLLNESATYLISKAKNKIEYQGKEFTLKPNDIIRSEGKLYLKRTYFGNVFGLQCNFNFRNLSVILDTDIDLPVIKEMRQELMRSNINKLQGDVKADTTIGRNYPAARFGLADWLVINTHDLEGQNDFRMNLALGGIIAGGETNVAFNYFSNQGFEERNQFYQWRHVKNERAALRQIILGKVQPGFISSVYTPSVGFQLTNTATTFKRSFGTYTISNTTNPGWIVELYVNNVLVNYVKADASGFYTFEVPLVYGNSVIKLRFYGPYGEERDTEEYINIPFSFMPARQLEYNVSGGFLEDGFHGYTTKNNFGDSVVTGFVEGQKNTLFTRSRVDYGLNSHITVGGGVEYLTSVKPEPFIPFINTSVRLAPLLLLTAEYANKVVGKTVLSYSLPSNVQFEINYSKYDRNQKAISFGYLEQRKFSVTFPVRHRKFSAYSRMSVNQIILKSTDYSTVEWLLSGAVSKVNYNLSSYALFVGETDPFIYSNISLSFHPYRRWVITPQLQYEYTQSRVVSYRGMIEHNLKGFGMVNAYYENNVQSNIQSVGVGLRMDLPFAQMAVQSIHSASGTGFTESANGGVNYNSRLNRIQAVNRTGAGKGGVILVPFVDMNGDGHRDADEPGAQGLKIIINGGRMQYLDADTAIRISELEPYTSYLIKLQPESFDNIAWRVKNKSIKVVVDPNTEKYVEIPVTVSAEVSGMVKFAEGDRSRGFGKIILRIYDSDMQPVGRTLSESDGFFTFTGLHPGSYTIKLDEDQLQKTGLKADVLQVPVTLKKSIDGDVIDGIEFVLTKKE